MKMEMISRRSNSRRGTRHAGRRVLAALLALVLTVEPVGGFTLSAQAASLNDGNQVPISTPSEIVKNDEPETMGYSEDSPELSFDDETESGQDLSTPSNADPENEQDLSTPSNADPDGIAPIALSADDEEVLKSFCQQYPGEYKLPDGSDWMITVSEEDGLKLSGDGAENATIDSITTSGETIKTVKFTSPDWYKSDGATGYQPLTLTWTTYVTNTTYAHKSFKCGSVTFYKADKSPLKAFTDKCYFIADGDDCIFSYGYFKEEYVGTYALSTEYGNTYGSDIDGIGSWKIEIDENGHVYLCVDEEHKYEAVMISGSTTNSKQRVNQMAVALPGWYTSSSLTTPVYLTLTWGYDGDSKSTTNGEGALYFTTAKITKAYTQEGGKKTIYIIPALRFERADLPNFAKSKLADYAGKYEVSDGTEEYIEITKDGSVELHIGEDTVLTPLYYEINNAQWRTGGQSAVTSVVFSKADWFSEANKTHPNAERATITMTWDPANLQFAVSSDAPCYKEGTTEVIRNFTTSIKYTRQETLDEGAAYFSQFVKGTYTLNDGSDWKIKVDLDETDNKWKIYTDFGNGEYEVANPSPVFVQDTTYTGEEGSKGEYGIGGKYLASVTVPVPGWYTDEGCTQPAVVTLNWHGEVINPMDDHQFTVTGMPIYRPIEGGTECKYLAGTFYSDHDRTKGQEFLKSYAGIYRPTAAGKWYIEIAADGTVTVHATDSQGTDHAITNVALDITIDKKIKDEKNEHYGEVTGVTDIKVVVPQWRTVQTNNTLANIMQCAETTFTLTPIAGGSSYFSPSADALIYANAKKDGSPWGVVTKTSADGYNKDLFTKIYTNDRAYTDANKDRAKAYFAEYPGTYSIIDSENNYYITVTEDGEIYWSDAAAVDAEPLLADVQFDAIHDANGDGKVNPEETTAVPGTISVWLNGYSTGKYTAKEKDTKTTDEIQRADLTWNDTNEVVSDDEVPDTAHRFKTSGSTAKGYKGGVNPQISFALDKYYARGDQYDGVFMEDGTYETTDGEYKIVIKTVDGKTTYTFYRPDLKDKGYPLTAFELGDTIFLRGKIGKMKKLDVYLVVTKGPYEGFDFLFTKYEVTYNDLNDKQQTSSSAPTFTLPAWTRFTNYAKADEGAEKNIIVAAPGEDVNTGTPYSRLSLALHNVQDGSTIYLKDDIKIGFEAMLPDGVGTVTIDGQGHKILRDTYVDPGSALNKISEEALAEILADPDVDPEILLTTLEEASGDGGDDTKEKEHYTGAILRVGEGDTVTLKNMTVDGEGQWEIDKEKLEEAIELNKDYDIVVTDELGGHPIKELEGNVVSTESLIKVAGGTLILDGVMLENFFAGDGYDDDRHFIDFMSTHNGKLEVTGKGAVFQHNASRSGVCIGNTDEDEIKLSNCTTMEDNYCYGGNGGLVVAMEGTQVFMDDGTKIVNNVAADTNGVFIQLHKKTDGVKDGDNKGTIYSKLHMDGGIINNNVGLRGGSYGWGQTIYLYNGGAFEMNGGEIGNNIGAGISSIYQQPSADALMLNKGWIHDNTCSLRDEGTDWPLDIAIMNIGTIGEDMIVDQSFVVGAAAILGGYASGDEYLTNNGEIHGYISVYSYFNNEGRVSTVINNNLIEGDIRLENGSMVKNAETGTIHGNITVRGALTESAGESSFQNEGKIEGNVELAENAHLYNGGDIEGNVTVKSGGTLTMNCNDPEHKLHGLHGGTIHGNVTVYPDGLIYAEVAPAYINGTLTFEYEDEADRKRMEEVLRDAGIMCDNVEYVQHVHTTDYDETTIEAKNESRCTAPWTIQYACKTCGKVVKEEEKEPTAHEYYVYKTDEETCTTGEIKHYRCKNCSAKELKLQVSKPKGHNFEELTEFYIPPTKYNPGRLYYKCTDCGKVVQFEVPEVREGGTRHSFQNEDGSLKKENGVEEPAATCKDEGKMIFTCENPGCEATIEITIPAKGHTFPLVADNFAEVCKVVETVESTCETAGHITYAPECTVCGTVDESGFTNTVNLPKLPHKWSKWENVSGAEDDEPIRCTAEREQIRTCELCGKTEERLGGETIHGDSKPLGGAGTVFQCSICNKIWGDLKVKYNLNGGIAPETLEDAGNKTYVYNAKNVKLWQPTSSWTKSTELGNAVFVGWSTVVCDEMVYTEEPKTANFVTAVDMDDTTYNNAQVYAVWALDRNDNGIPDYNENIEITTFTVHYEANGGIGDVPADETHSEGEKVTLAFGDDIKIKRESAVFIGWSLEQQDIITSQDEENSAEIISEIDRIKANITVYAVWAIDVMGGSGTNPDSSKPIDPVENPSNPDGTADYREETGLSDTFKVHYDVNGGTGTVAEETYRKGDKVTLDGGESITLENAVFIGWSLGKHEGIIKSQAEEESARIITEIASIEADITVYAVWASDVMGGSGKDPDSNKPIDPVENPSNPDGIPDYREESTPPATEPDPGNPSEPSEGPGSDETSGSGETPSSPAPSGGSTSSNPSTRLPGNPAPQTEIPDSPVPLAAEPMSQELVAITDDDVPLAFMAPMTGDNKPVGAAALLGLLALGMMGAFGILSIRKKDEDA